MSESRLGAIISTYYVSMLIMPDCTTVHVGLPRIITIFSHACNLPNDIKLDEKVIVHVTREADIAAK